MRRNMISTRKAQDNTPTLPIQEGTGLTSFNAHESTSAMERNQRRDKEESDKYKEARGLFRQLKQGHGLIIMFWSFVRLCWKMELRNSNSLVFLAMLDSLGSVDSIENMTKRHICEGIP